MLALVLNLEQGTSKTRLTRFLNVHYLSLASELSVERGPKKEMVFNTRYSAYTSLSQSKLPSDAVQGQRPTTSLPSAFGILGRGMQWCCTERRNSVIWGEDFLSIKNEASGQLKWKGMCRHRFYLFF